LREKGEMGGVSKSGRVDVKIETFSYTVAIIAHFLNILRVIFLLLFYCSESVACVVVGVYNIIGCFPTPYFYYVDFPLLSY